MSVLERYDTQIAGSTVPGAETDQETPSLARRNFGLLTSLFLAPEVINRSRCQSTSRKERCCEHFKSQAGALPHVRRGGPSVRTSALPSVLGAGGQAVMKLASLLSNFALAARVCAIFGRSIPLVGHRDCTKCHTEAGLSYGI